MTLVYRDADLNQFPQIKRQDSKHLSLGDLHGNALKLIYILIEEGVLELNKEHYEALKAIYNTETTYLTSEQLATFKDIIFKAKVNTDKAITLIGDDLADRGNNDYFTLLVLKKLHDSQVNLDVLLSNHSAEFIRDYDQDHFTGFYNLGPGQGASLSRMCLLIAKGLIKEDEVRTIVKENYIPKAKAISYTLSPEGELTLFTHAPVGLETVQSLAKKFKIPYKDKSIKELTQTIDKINRKIEYHFMHHELSKLIDEEGYVNPSIPISPHTHPLRRLLWNRVVSKELVTETSSGIKIKFVHGHVGDDPVLKDGRPLSSHENLDSSWGKFPEVNKTGAIVSFGKIKHLTRHSNDLTTKELNNALWYKITIESAENQFMDLFFKLKEKTNELIEKGTQTSPLYDVRYKNVALAAKKLEDELLAAKAEFFKQKPNKENIQQFSRSINEAVRTANMEFVKHRGTWYGGGNFLIDFLKGVLQFLDTIILYLPNVINKMSNRPHYSFMKTPSTKSSEKLGAFDQDVNQLIKEIETANFSSEDETLEKNDPLNETPNNF